ncbi:MAG: transcriptional regulator [Chloroflexaceae bacterium]|nr:transcriptional regulator [Chloroflexaceae bacterium]
MNPFRNRKPILEVSSFYGRHSELRAIYQQLLLQPPQCCAVIGLPRSGKTSLLYALHHTQQHEPPAALRITPLALPPVFVYVNAGPYVDLGEFHLQGALYFWRDIAYALAQSLPGEYAAPSLAGPVAGDSEALDQIYALRQYIASTIRDCPDVTVVFLIDNAEGLARLPRSTSSLLRTLIQDSAIGDRMAYVATSHVPLYQLYDPATLQEPSSFWSLFAETIYLGLLEPDEAHALIMQRAAATPQHLFNARDAAMLLQLAGRHSDLLTLACALLHDWRTREPDAHPFEWTVFEDQLYEAAVPLCQAIWQSLRDTVPGVYTVLGHIAEQQPFETEQQRATLPLLERLGMIEQRDDRYYIFSQIMHRFVRQQLADMLPLSEPEPVPIVPSAAPLAPEPLPFVIPADNLPEHTPLPPAFTHLESAVYSFLSSNAGVVCDRESIKRAVWKDTPPSDSALQKLIERIREKIEPDPKHPRRLIAVRGQGYILRTDISS